MPKIQIVNSNKHTERAGAVFEMKIHVGLSVVLVFVGLLSLCAGASEPIVGVSDPVCVDTMSSTAKTVKQAVVPVTYSPFYSGAVAGSAHHVVLRKVVGCDTQWAETNVVAEFIAGEFGEYSFTFDDADVRNVRLIHTTYDSEGNRIGDELSADLGYAYTGESAQDAVVDTRTNSLQLAAENFGRAAFAYSSDWAEGVAALVEIRRIHETGIGKSFHSAVTSVVFSADAPVTGLSEQILLQGGGLYKYLFTSYDASGEPIGEPYSASYWFKEKFGMAIILK